MNSAFAPRRPKFRLVAATAMVGLIIVGMAAMALAAAVALNGLAETIGWKGVLPPANTGTPQRIGWLTSLWGFVSSRSVFELGGFALAMLLSAFLVRKVVLSGLRD